MIRRAKAWLSHTETAELLRSGSTLLVGQIVAAGLTFILTLVFARELGAVGYGKLALILTTVTIVSQLIDSRVWEAATRFATEHIAAGRRSAGRAVLELAIALNLAGGLVASAVVILASGWLASSLLDTPSLAESLKIYAAIAPLVALQAACVVFFRVLDRISELAILTPLSALARLAAAGPAAIISGDIETIVTALLAAEAFSALVIGAMTVKRLRHDLPADAGFRRRVAELKGGFGKMGRFLVVSNAQGTLRLFNNQLDVLVVGAIAGPAPAGSLRLARTIVTPLSLASQPFYQTLYPQLSKARVSGNLKAMQTVILRSVKLSSAVLLPAGVVLAAVSPVLVPLLAGEGFSDTYQVLIPLAIGTAIAGTLFWVHAAALTLDLQQRSLLALTIASAVQFGLVLALAGSLGAPAAGIAYLAFLLVWTSILVPPVWSKIRELVADEAAAA